MAVNGHTEPIHGKFKGKDILTLDQFSKKDLDILFPLTKKMASIRKQAKPSDILKGNIVTLLFFEPSSRTFGSFSAAVKQLGGATIEIQNPQTVSSVSKGETLEDTTKTFESYSDAIVIRHFESGTAKKIATVADIPVINAGDGVGEHPTQALLDLYTLYQHHKKIDGITGVLAGDMLNGRTVHSLIRALSLYKNVTLYLLSPRQLRLNREEFDAYSKRGVKLIEIDDENNIPENAHFWYWTRVQKERFTNLSDYEKVKNKFVLTKKMVEKKAGKRTIFMHPLPRVGEILTEVDSDPRAVYLRYQMRNGVYLRMALLSLVLGKL